MSDVNSIIDVNHAVGNDVITFDASKQIQADITSRLERCISPANGILGQIRHCSNDNVIMSQQQFVANPDNPTVVENFLGEQTRRLLPAEIRDTGGNDYDAQLLKSLLGMLKVKEDCFTENDKKIYEKVCKRLASTKPSDGEIKTKMKNDDNLWQPLMPLIEKYGVEISEDLMAHMIDQSVNAWCHYHKNATREWAINNLDKVFSTQVRVCFHMLDFHNKKLANASTELSNGTLLRHRMMEVMSVIGTIPLTLIRRENTQTNHQSTAPEVKEGERPTPDVTDSPGSPTTATPPNTFNIYGSKAVANGGQCCCREKSAVNNDALWCTLVDKLLACDKLNDKQLFALMKALIDALASHPGAISQSLKSDAASAELATLLKNATLLSSLDHVRTGEAAESVISPTIKGGVSHTGQASTLNARRSYEMPDIPEPDYSDNEDNTPINVRFRPNSKEHTTPANTPTYTRLPNGDVSPSRSSSSRVSSLSTLSDELVQFSQERGLRRVTSSASTDLGIPAKHPLNNFSIATWEERQVNNAPRVFALAKDIEAQDPTEGLSPLSLRRQKQPLSLVVEAKAANNENLHLSKGRDSGRYSLSPSASSATSLQDTGIPAEDTAILKRWLKEAASGDEEELYVIDALQPDGVRVATLEHFLESAFIASPGTERRSDLRQGYIRAAFNLLKTHDEFDSLNEKTRLLVEKYAMKRNHKVFATSPTRVSYLHNDFF